MKIIHLGFWYFLILNPVDTAQQSVTKSKVAVFTLLSQLSKIVDHLVLQSYNMPSYQMSRIYRQESSMAD